MCLPGLGVIERCEGDGLDRVAVVVDGTRRRRVSLACVPEAQVGDAVMIHSGYAVRTLSPAEAGETQTLIDHVR